MNTYGVYYMKPDFFQDGIMGAKWCRRKGMLPDPSKIDATHIYLGVFKATDLEDLFRRMQGENWSPNGEAAPMIAAKGLHHTSMSVGDIAVDCDSFDCHMVDSFGFVRLGGPSNDR